MTADGVRCAMREGNHEHRYRENTKRIVKSAPGVMSVTFMCRKCRVPRAIAGRVMRVKGCKTAGYLCAGCAAERCK